MLPSQVNKSISTNGQMILKVTFIQTSAAKKMRATTLHQINRDNTADGKAKIKRCEANFIAM
jgi:hypothetical protein